MGVRERREREREQARGTILAAARELMREVGPSTVSLREVARRAEYSPATLYEYFKDKEAIFLALFHEGFHLFAEALRVVPPDLPPDVRLAALGRAYFLFADANPQHYQVMFGEPVPGFCPTQEDWQEADATFMILYQCIADGVAAGVFRPMDPEATWMAAITAWSLMHGIVTLAHAGRFGDYRHDPQLLDRALTFLHQGLHNSGLSHAEQEA